MSKIRNRLLGQDGMWIVFDHEITKARKGYCPLGAMLSVWRGVVREFMVNRLAV